MSRRWIKLLDEDEKILWKSVKIINLLKIFASNLIILPFVISIPFTLILFNLEYKLLSAIELLTQILIGEIILIIITFLIILKGRISIVTTYQLPRKELKEYNMVYSITNKRIIQQNYKEAIRSQRKILKHQINCVKIQFDTIMLNLDDISEIWFNRHNKTINFYSNENRFYVFRFNFQKFKELTKYRIPEMEKAMEILREILPLERIEENKYLVKYLKVPI
jgi:hypothetical protein